MGAAGPVSEEGTLRTLMLAIKGPSPEGKRQTPSWLTNLVVFQTAVKYKLCLNSDAALHHRPRTQDRVPGMQPTFPSFPHY